LPPYPQSDFGYSQRFARLLAHPQVSLFPRVFSFRYETTISPLFCSGPEKVSKDCFLPSRVLELPHPAPFFPPRQAVVVAGAFLFPPSRPPYVLSNKPPRRMIFSSSRPLSSCQDFLFFVLLVNPPGEGLLFES